MQILQNSVSLHRNGKNQKNTKYDFCKLPSTMQKLHMCAQQIYQKHFSCTLFIKRKSHLKTNLNMSYKLIFTISLYCGHTTIIQPQFDRNSTV